MIIHVNKIIKAKSFEKLRNIEIVTRIEHKMMKFNKCHDVQEATLPLEGSSRGNPDPNSAQVACIVFNVTHVQFSK